MRAICILFCLAGMLTCSLTAFAQKPLYKIFLIGDAGDDEMTNQTLDSLKSHLRGNPNSAVIFLGDNSYRNALGGLLPYGYKGFDSSQQTQNKVRSQLDIVNNYKGSVYFVPGNHDWWNLMNLKRGRTKLKMEENFIEQNLAKNTSIQNPDNTYLPRNGTPGPAQVELENGHIKVIFIDTYWLMLAQYKRNPRGNLALANGFYHNLDSLLAEASSKKQKILIVAHHPVYYQRYTTKHRPLWLLPKRIAQSDPSFYSYSKMSAQVNAILKKYPGVYYASGHMHAIQYHVTEDSIHYIISGAGSKLIHVPKKEAAQSVSRNGKDCIFWNDKGFFELAFYKDGEKVIIYDDEGKKKCDLTEPGGCR